jgi:hypothetical protein
MEIESSASPVSNKSMDRGALSDLWRNTLLRIPTVYGRLSYLASLLETDSGRYRHHGLADVFGRNESHAALRDSHMEVFREWINLPLRDRHADLKQYLVSLPERSERVIRNWRRSRVYRNSVPVAAGAMERELFHADIEALLRLLQNAVDSAPQDSSPPE